MTENVTPADAEMLRDLAERLTHDEECNECCDACDEDNGIAHRLRALADAMPVITMALRYFSEARMIDLYNSLQSATLTEAEQHREGVKALLAVLCPPPVDRPRGG
jgi:hypothetical protein